MGDARAGIFAVVLFGLGGVIPDDGTAASAAPEMHSYVTIDGSRYLVATLGERVRVTAKPAPVAASAEARDRMRLAVIEATGCRIVEDRWSGVALLGELDCRERLPRKDR